MKAIETHLKLRVRVLAGIAAILVALSAGAIAWTLRDGGTAAASTDPGASARLSAANERIPLNAHQCQIAQSMLADARKNRPMLVQAVGTAAAAQFDAEVESTGRWIAAGCPPDPVRGFSPSPDGNGGSIRLFTNQSFSGGQPGSKGVIILTTP